MIKEGFDNWGAFRGNYYEYNLLTHGLVNPHNPPYILRDHKPFWTARDIDVFYELLVHHMVYRLFHVTIIVQLMMHYPAKVANSEVLSMVFSLFYFNEMWLDRLLCFTLFAQTDNFWMFFMKGNDNRVLWR